MSEPQVLTPVRKFMVKLMLLYLLLLPRSVLLLLLLLRGFRALALISSKVPKNATW